MFSIYAARYDLILLPAAIAAADTLMLSFLSRHAAHAERYAIIFADGYMPMPLFCCCYG